MNKEPWLTGIKLYDVERNIVINEDARLGFKNLSATMRFIIRKYEEMRQRQLTDLDPASQYAVEAKQEA